MKRALMTFGNIFGLALYDKTQENVVDEPEAPRISDAALSYMDKIDKEMTAASLDALGKTIAGAVASMPRDQADVVRAHFGSRKKALKQAENLAA
jgi:hypothetical protein